MLRSFQFVSLHLNIPPKWGYFYPAATKLLKECTEHKIPPGICCSCLTSPFLSCNKRKIISFIIIQLSSTKKSMYHRYGRTRINFKFNDLHLQFTFQLDSTSFLWLTLCRTISFQSILSTARVSSSYPSSWQILHQRSSSSARLFQLLLTWYKHKFQFCNILTITLSLYINI